MWAINKTDIGIVHGLLLENNTHNQVSSMSKVNGFLYICKIHILMSHICVYRYLFLAKILNITAFNSRPPTPCFKNSMFLGKGGD